MVVELGCTYISMWILKGPKDNYFFVIRIGKLGQTN